MATVNVDALYNATCPGCAGDLTVELWPERRDVEATHRSADGREVTWQIGVPREVATFTRERGWQFVRGKIMPWLTGVHTADREWAATRDVALDCVCGGRLAIKRRAGDRSADLTHTSRGGRRAFASDVPVAANGIPERARLDRWLGQVHAIDEREKGGAMPTTNAPAAPPASDLKGVAICVTGKIAGYTRQSIGAAIAGAGGTNHKEVLPYTDYLVVGERPGGVKLREARLYGVATRDETWLLASIQFSLRLQNQRKAAKLGTSRPSPAIGFSETVTIGSNAWSTVTVSEKPIVTVRRPASASANVPDYETIADALERGDYRWGVPAAQYEFGGLDGVVLGDVLLLNPRSQVAERDFLPLATTVVKDAIGNRLAYEGTTLLGWFRNDNTLARMTQPQGLDGALPVFGTVGDIAAEPPWECALDRETGILWVYKDGIRIGRMESAVNMAEIVPAKQAGKYPGKSAAEIGAMLAPAPAPAEPGPPVDPLTGIARRQRGERRW